MLSYEQTLRLFEKWCKEEQGISTVDKVNENVIRRYIFDLQERGKYTFYSNDKQKAINYPERRRDFRKPVSTITINNYIRNLRVFFNYLERNYIIKKNPMKRVRQLKSNREPKVYLTDDELRKLLSKFDRSYFSEHRDYVMILLMLDSGMRLGECSTLLVSDLELSRKRINLRAEETKGRKERTVFFSPKTEKALRSWLQYKDRYVESDYLFPVKEHGGSIGVGNFEGNFRKYIERAGLNEQYTPHCLRNNFAKRCLMNGMDIYTLSKILGHSSVTVTEQAYLDINDDDMSKRYQHSFLLVVRLVVIVCGLSGRGCGLGEGNVLIVGNLLQEPGLNLAIGSTNDLLAGILLVADLLSPDSNERLILTHQFLAVGLAGNDFFNHLNSQTIVGVLVCGNSCGAEGNGVVGVVFVEHCQFSEFLGARSIRTLAVSLGQGDDLVSVIKSITHSLLFHFVPFFAAFRQLRICLGRHHYFSVGRGFTDLSLSIFTPILYKTWYPILWIPPSQIIIISLSLFDCITPELVPSNSFFWNVAERCRYL